MLKIEIKSPDVTIVNKEFEGKPYTVYEQKAYWHKKGEDYPLGLMLRLEKNQPGYNPGFYTLDLDESLYLKYNRFAIRSMVKLTPITSEARKAS